MWKPDLFTVEFKVMVYTKDIFLTTDCNSITIWNDGKSNAGANIAPDVLVDGLIRLMPQNSNRVGNFTVQDKYQITFGGNFGEHLTQQIQLKFDRSGTFNDDTLTKCIVIRKMYKNRKEVIEYLKAQANIK